MSAHTPGPWVMGNENNECCDVECGGGRTSISLNRMDSLGMKDMNISRDEMLANAHLVAAAPDLLSALETLVEEEQPAMLYGDVGRAWRAAFAAIAKVRGGK